MEGEVAAVKAKELGAVHRWKSSGHPQAGTAPPAPHACPWCLTSRGTTLKDDLLVRKD